MNVDADMVGDQPDDALAVRRRQSFARVGQAFTEPIDPKASVGVEHDFDDGGIGEPGGARRAERCAQHPRAARIRLRSSSEEHTYELQSLMRISYAVLCLK